MGNGIMKKRDLVVDIFYNFRYKNKPNLNPSDYIFKDNADEGFAVYIISDFSFNSVSLHFNDDDTTVINIFSN